MKEMKGISNFDGSDYSADWQFLAWNEYRFEFNDILIKYIDCFFYLCRILFYLL